MIYLLFVLHFLFLLITVSSKQCREVVTITGGHKESSQTGHYFGEIHTPDFPQPFATPFAQTWVIDASQRSEDTLINVYFTQMYLSKGVRIFQHPTHPYKHCDQVSKYHGPRQECTKAEDQNHKEIIVDKLHELLRVSTTCPYFEIQVTVPQLYGYHYRTRDPFLFEVYGFNITYEIVPESVGIRNDSCYLANCSSLGHCYIAENWRDFFCDCVKDKPGKYCDVNRYCDPENNRNFCKNGGKCKIFGSGLGYCDCPEMFTGPKCEKMKDDVPKTLQVKTGCSDPKGCLVGKSTYNCSLDKSRSPCSCRPSPKDGKYIPDWVNWVKYEAVFNVSDKYDPPKTLKTLGYEVQNDISQLFKANNLTISYNSVRVSFYPQIGDYPYSIQKVLVHFRGSKLVFNQTRSVLDSWLNDNKANKHIPIVTKGFNMTTFSRLRFKSIEVSKGDRLKLNKPVSLTCTAYSSAGPNDIRFRWFKDNLPIDDKIASRGMRFVDSRTGNETMSVLMIDLVHQFDEGKITCEVTDLEFGDQVCGETLVQISLPPVLEIQPMSLTLEKQKLDKSAVITCTDASNSPYDPHNKTTTFIWSSGGKEVENNDMVVLEDIYPQGKILRILKAERSEVFKCSGYSKDGEERYKIVEVNVLDSKNNPSCKPQWERLPNSKSDKKGTNGLLWEWTAPRFVAKTKCPEGYNGYVERPCMVSQTGAVEWGRSDFSHCISEKLRILNKTLQHAKSGFANWQGSSVTWLMENVQNYTISRNRFFPGEGEGIIAILEDIVNYAVDKGKASSLFSIFFRTVTQFLKIPNSCVHEKSVIALSKVIANVALHGAIHHTSSSKADYKTPKVNLSDVLMLQVLPISEDENYQNYSYVFPAKEVISNPVLSWLKDKLRVNFPLYSDGFRKDSTSPTAHYLIMAAYKNLSSLLLPNDKFQQSGGGISIIPANNNRNPKRSLSLSIELITPVVQISIPDGYYFPTDSHIIIHFNLSKEDRSLVVSNRRRSSTSTTLSGLGNTMNHLPLSTKGTHFSCGVLDNTGSSRKTDSGRLRWSMDACGIHHHGSFVECQCDTLGIFGLLKVSNLEDKLPSVNNDVPRVIIIGLSLCILSCVMSAIVLCIYLKCRTSLNSLYALKLLDCAFILAAVFIVLLERTEIPSSSRLTWSTLACSFLISSLNVQVMKASRILLMDVKSDLRGFIFPLLGNVPQVTFLFGIILCSVLFMWTVTVAQIIAENATNESAFAETSLVFLVFAVTVVLVVLIFLYLYYKAYLKTRGKLEQCQSDSYMQMLLTYRKETLKRSFCLTLVLLILTLSIVLYENLRQSIYIQYFLGFSAIGMSIALVLCYVTHSEFPLLATLCSTRPTTSSKPWPDPEKDVQKMSSKGSQLKSLSGGVSGNGCNGGTTCLIPPANRQNVPRNIHYGDESEPLSTTVEECSMNTVTTGTEMSYPPQIMTKEMPIPHYNNRRSKSIKSARSNNTISSSASSYHSRRHPSTSSDVLSSNSMLPGLNKIRCQLRTSEEAEYVLPNPMVSNGKPKVEPDVAVDILSSEPRLEPGITNSPYYLPITDNHNNHNSYHEDFKKINENLNSIFSD